MLEVKKFSEMVQDPKHGTSLRPFTKLIQEIQQETWSFFSFYKNPIVEYIYDPYQKYDRYKLRFAPFLNIDNTVTNDDKTICFMYKDFSQNGNKYKNELVEFFRGNNHLPLLPHIGTDFIIRCPYYSNMKVNISYMKKIDEFLLNNFWKILSPQEIAYTLMSLDMSLSSIWKKTRENLGIEPCPNSFGGTNLAGNPFRGILNDINAQSDNLSIHKYNLWFLNYMTQRFIFDDDIKDAFNNDHPFKEFGPATCLENYQNYYEEFFEKFSKSK